jgi:hypothetical protein
MREEKRQQTLEGPTGGTPSRLPKLLPGALIGVLIVVIGVGLSDGAAFHPWIRVIGALVAVMYGLSAIGIGGSLARMLWRMKGVEDARPSWGVAAALGFSIMLAVSHLMGVLGLLSVERWWIALGVMVPGLVLFGVGAARRPRVAGGAGWGLISAWVFFAALAASWVVLSAGAMVSPGWLWPSEFGAFDSLSYHLQLPKEWLASGRLWPVSHNVYSYLPSAMEAAYMHVMAACGVIGGAAPALSQFEAATLEAGGVGANVLHAFCAVCAAVAVGGVAKMMAARAGASEDRQGMAAFGAGVLFLATPWVVVVGSISYNEMPMLLMFAGALVVAGAEGLRGWLRGLVVGWLVGMACMVKPTALLFVGVPCGVALLAWMPRRGWFIAVVCGGVAGLAALLPYLVRNGMASGNPVFPYLHDVLGSGHWSAEQFTRFAGGHHFSGSWLERLRLLVLPDAHDPAGARHRGLLHPQFAMLFPVTALAAAVMLWRRELRAALWVLVAALLVQIVMWLGATHIQSRFLLPLAVPACVLVGVVGMGAVWERRWMARAGVVVVAGAAVWGAGSLVVLSQSSLPASVGTIAANGADAFHGLALREVDWSKESAETRREALEGLGPVAFVNRMADEGRLGGGKVYLLGDSTPFYMTPPVVWHTTWDRSPLGVAMSEFPGETRWWSRALRERGVSAVVVNFAELARLRGSGWYDPAVTAEGVEKFVRSELVAVRVWEKLGVGLYVLKGEEAGSASGGEWP